MQIESSVTKCYHTQSRCCSRAFTLVMVVVFCFFCSTTLTLAEEEDTPTIKRLLSSSINLLTQQKPHAANILLNQILLLDPNHAEAHFRLGQSHMQQRKALEAVDYIKKSIELDPSNVVYSLYLARIYDKQGDLVKAQAEYQRFIDSGAETDRMKEVEMLYSLTTGRILAEKKEFNAALLVFNGLLLDHPDDPQVLFSISNAYMALQRYDEAEAIYKKLFELNPQNETVNFSLAKIYAGTNRPTLAMQHLKNIIDLNLGDERHRQATIEYNIIRGRELLKLNDWNGALEAYKIAVELEPTRTEAFFNIAMAQLQLGNVQLAERGFLNVIRINPDDFLTRLNLAQLYYNLDKTDLAKEQLLYIIENDKSGQFSHQAKIRLNVIHTLLADKALESGNIEKSLQEYSNALDFFSANVKASFNRGMIYIQRGDFAAAQLEFESVLRHEPDNVQARINLSNIYEQLNLYAKAAEQYELVLQGDKETQEWRYASARWRNAKARGLWEKGQIDEAEALFNEIVTDEPGNYEAYTYLGIIQSSKGNLKEATKSYQSVLDVRPNNYPVRILLGRAYEQLGLDFLAANEYRYVIFTGGDAQQVPEAELRLAGVEARLSGFSNNLSYLFAYDSNLNFNDAFPIEEIRSDLALSFIYGIKTTDLLGFRFSWSPTYSAYHLNQTDYFLSDLQSRASYGTPDNNWSLTLQYQEQENLVRDNKLSQASRFQISKSKKLFLSPFYQLPSEDGNNHEVATSTSTTFSLRHITSFSDRPIESIAGSLTFSFFQNLKWDIGTSVSYSLTLNRSLNNTVIREAANIRVERDEVSGFEDQVADEVTTFDSKDYEYNSHTVSMSLRKVLAPGVVGAFAINSALTLYVNPDSGESTRGDSLTNRMNVTVGSGVNISYFFFKDISLFASANYQRNISSLPVGLSSGFDSEDAIASLQSTSLGDYSRYSFELGFSMDF